MSWTYAAIGGTVLAAGWYMSRPSYFPNRKPWTPEPPTHIAQRGTQGVVISTSPDATATIAYAAEGVASRRFPTLVHAFQECVKINGDKVALRVETTATAHGGTWKEITYKQYYDTAVMFAKALLAIGFEQHRTVSICGFNACEWHYSFMGAIVAGGKGAGIYTTNSPDACQYVAEHSESVVVVVDTIKTLNKFLEKKDALPLVRYLVVYQEPVPAEITSRYHGYVYSFDDFLALGKGVSEDALNERIAAISPAHCASLIYTSGTTGNPKACMISHDNIMYDASAMVESIGVQWGGEEHVISYLPLSHVAAQGIDIVYPIFLSSIRWSVPTSCAVSFARPDALKGSLAITMKMVRPTLFMGVPRVWEKFVEGIKEKAKQNHLTGLKRRLVDWCKDVGLRAALAQQADGDGIIPRGYAIAEKILFSKVKQALGLDRVKYCATGAAPISRDTLSFLGSLGIIVFEAYGMSESTSSTSASGPAWFRWGSAGARLPGCEIEIFHDPHRDKPNEGEICFRGRHIMMGYMKDDKKTAEAIDRDGWLHSGDVGYFDKYGLLHITGRIKELIIGAGGENIAPVPIEDEIKAQLPAVSNVIMIGDKRKFNVCLIALKSRQNMATGEFTDELVGEALAVNPAVNTVTAARGDKVWNDYLTKGIKAYNEGPVCVSNAQRIQYFRILPVDVSIPGGELTGTMKLKRNVINEKYHDLIESMYKE